MSLRAEIHKKLGAFSLDISLETQGGVLGLLGASSAAIVAIAVTQKRRKEDTE